MRYHFADCVLDTALRTLHRQGQPVRLRPRVFQMLVHLLEQRHRAVPRDEIFAQVWKDRFVSEAALEGCIKLVRQTIGDSGRAQRLIQTQHGYGYRFVAPVTAEEPKTATASADQRLHAALDSQDTLPTTTLETAPIDVISTPAPPSPDPALPAGPPASGPERRQLTVLSCTLTDDAVLAGRLDPDEVHEVIRVFHACCTDVIQQCGGSIAHRLEHGLLAYFGYPQAHGDDARRAVHTGLRLVTSLYARPLLVPQTHASALAVQVGIHTGPVVLEHLDASGPQTVLAVGATPTIAVGLRDLAAPQSVVVSATTAHLVEGFFAWQPLPPWTPPGHTDPLAVYRVTGESGAQIRLDLVAPHRLTAFVGREPELALLQERWGQVLENRGQVVVLSGEAGIGKSRLVRELRARMDAEFCLVLESRGSTYQQHTPLAPMREWLHALLCGNHPAADVEPIARIEQMLRQHDLVVEEHLPLLASVLDLGLPMPQYPPLPLSPQQRRQRTLESLVALLLRLTATQPVLFVLEDLHWVDPSTLEWLDLLFDQVPGSRLMLLLTCRPEFQVPWPARSYHTHVTLPRLSRPQSAQMVQHVAQGPLPAGVRTQIVAQTDGVPLFVEELTRTVLDTGSATAIPTTLQDALTARLDQVGTAKRVAQLGGTIGRQFTYELLRAVAPMDETTLRQELHRLVAAELVYQYGLPPEATYTFKHALIQAAAYQSQVRRTRQQVHRCIAQILEAQFPDTAETQPELLAHHYTEAGLAESAVHYWHRAGQMASERSAYQEAMAHFKAGLAALRTLPDAAGRTRHELRIQMALGGALSAAKGHANIEVAHAYQRALALSEQTGEPSQHFEALFGLWRFYLWRSELPTARDMGAQYLGLGQRHRDAALVLEGRLMLGQPLSHLGDMVAARPHLEHGRVPCASHPQSLRLPEESLGTRIGCLVVLSWTLWTLGYPDQALEAVREARTLAHELDHPFTLAMVYSLMSSLHRSRREWQAVQVAAEAAIAIAGELGVPVWLAKSTIQRGWALAAQGQLEEGLALIRQSLDVLRSTGTALFLPGDLAGLAEVHLLAGQMEAGLAVVAEALTLMDKTGERWYAAELHRLRGELFLRQTVPDMAQAEAHLQQALVIARYQQTRSWELRAATSLARLWLRQGKCQTAYDLLAPVYAWFTEGFATADLQEAQALLENTAKA
jgi:DNA-binding winged helix-turn-helix (wHTH) protein/predicted ATPase